jgi:ribosomal protein S18 acetylase RimI-like enzyme
MIEIKVKNSNRIEALKGKKVVGYILFDYARDESKKRNIEIEYIYVKPKHRGQGIASDLIQYLIAVFPNVVWFSLWTGKEIEENEGTALYTKNGFELLGYQKDFYGEGVGVSLFGLKQK